MVRLRNPLEGDAPTFGSVILGMRVQLFCFSPFSTPVIFALVSSKIRLKVLCDCRYHL